MFIMDFKTGSSLKILLITEVFTARKDKDDFKDAKLIYYHAKQNLWLVNSVP